MPLSPDDPVPWDMLPNFEITSYYLRLYRQEGRTQARARMEREMWLLMWEGGDLLTREMYDVERDLETVPWKWKREPSFLREFDRWYEKTLHELGWKRIQVYY
jgi:hypothetical protein